MGHVLRLPIDGDILFYGELTQNDLLAPIIEFIAIWQNLFANILIKSSNIGPEFGVEQAHRLINAPEDFALEASVVLVIFAHVFCVLLGETLGFEFYVHLDLTDLGLIKLRFGLHRAHGDRIGASGNLVGLRHSGGLLPMGPAACEILVWIRLRQIGELGVPLVETTELHFLVVGLVEELS